MARGNDNNVIRADVVQTYIEDGVLEMIVDADRSTGSETTDDTDEYRRRSYFQHRGFFSIPVSTGTPDQIILLRSGNTYMGVASAGDPDKRPALSEEGDTAIYADESIYISLLADGTISITNGSGTILMSADGSVDINGGNLTVDA